MPRRLILFGRWGHINAGHARERSMKIKSEKTREVDARTNQTVEKMQFDVDSHDDYLRLREQFSRMPKIPMLLRADEAPVTTAPNRTYNWFMTSEQSGGSIVIHMLTLEPGFAAEEHHHPAEEEFFFCARGRA
jgi:hypothetical protein